MSVVLATAGYDHKVRFWEAPSGRCSRIIKFPDSPVHRLEISPDKQFIAAAGNPVIRVYEVVPDHHHGSHPQHGDGTSHHNPHHQAVLTLEGHQSNVTSIGFQKDGRYLYSGSEDGTIKVWDLRNPNFTRSLNVGAAVNSVALRADRDEFISGDQDGYVKIWDLASGKCINELRPCAGNLPADASSAVTGGTPTPQASSQPSTILPSSSAGTPRSLKAPQQRHFFSEGSAPIQAVDISEDSRTLVAISNHGTVFVWDPSVGRAPTPSLAEDVPPTTTGDGASGVPPQVDPVLAGIDTPSTPSLDIVAASLLTPITKFRAHAPGTYCLHGKIAPDCRHLVTCSSDGTARLWDTATWELSSILSTNGNHNSQNNNGGHSSSWVWDAAFCADSTYLVTSSSDRIARLWNLRTSEVVRQYHGHESAVTAVALNDSNVI